AAGTNVTITNAYALRVNTGQTYLGGALTVSSGGAAITGNSSVTGTLSVSSTLTASNALTVTTGNATFSSLNGTGNRIAILDSSGVLGRGSIDPADILTTSSGTVSGSGTSGYLALWNGTSSITDSGLYQSSGNVALGTATTSNGTLTVRRGTSGNAITVRNTADSANSFFVTDAGALYLAGSATVGSVSTTQITTSAA